MGRTPKNISPDQIEQIKKCAGYGLTIEEISHVINIPIATLKRHMKSDEIVGEAYAAGRAIAKEMVVGKLFDLIRNGEPSAIYFYLKCQGGWREKEKDVVETTAVPITIYLPEKDAEPTT
jgi:hypothetical protein